MRSRSQTAKDIVEVCRRIHQRGWISSTDGNVSVRLPGNKIIITPSGIHKGFMTERELVVVDMKGNVLEGRGKPSSELAMHITCYNERPEINAVVHAHPTLSIAFSLAGITLARCLLPEVVFTLGSIPTAEYAAPTTGEVPDSIKRYIKDYDAMILERHGSLTIGVDLFSAYNTLERMEHVAEITYHARQLGQVKPLSKGQVDQLLQIGADKGWPERKLSSQCCDGCNACSGEGGSRPVKETAPSRDKVLAAVVEEVTAAVMKDLR